METIPPVGMVSVRRTAHAARLPFAEMGWSIQEKSAMETMLRVGTESVYPIVHVARLREVV